MNFIDFFAIIIALHYLLKLTTIAYRKKSSKSKIPFYRRNDYIKKSPILLIDENGDKVGKVETKKALEMAKKKELDLVEVAPNAKPPVCKIMSWSKFKYELSKKRKSSSKGKAKDMKEMWFTPYIDEGDIEHKLKRVREFLEDRHPVKLTVRVKGRVSKNLVRDQLKSILKRLEGECKMEGHMRREGRNMSAIVLPENE